MDVDDTAQDTLIAYPVMANNSPSKNGDNEDVGELLSSPEPEEASDDGELMSEGEDDNKKADEEESEGELKSSDDEISDHDGDELEEGEEGEVLPERRKGRKNHAETNNNNSSKKDDDLEEGEVSDEDNVKPKSVCRFFGKGQCTWGSNCRFLHPGVTDKGFYTMFDNVRPPLLPNPPAAGPGGPPPPMMFTKPGLLGHAPPNYPPIQRPGPPPPQADMMHPIPPPPAAPMMTAAPAVPESAWERGLRHAKEMLKQSAVRKETDIDFEDKKMNQSLCEDLDKENENDYYINARKPGDEAEERDSMRRREYDPTKMDVTRERMNHRLESTKRREAPPRDDGDDMMVRRKRREAPPLGPDEKAPRFPPGPPQRGHPAGGPDDDWHDPWMRSSSYHRRPGPRRRSRSSSYSSSSDHRRRPSSGEESSPSKNRRIRKAPPRNLSPKPMRIAPPKEEPFERSSAPISRLERGALKRRVTRSSSKSRSRSSSSVTSTSSKRKKRRDSWSSSSSSLSRSSSASSAAYRRRGAPAKKRHTAKKLSPPVKSSPPPSNPPVRQPPPLRQAPARPAPPPQIQVAEKKRNQIKMTLKEQGKVKANKNVLDKLSDEIMGGADDQDDDDDDDSLHGAPRSPMDTKPILPVGSGKKKAPGRREELLKQLKAVEEAIAKKRSKIL